jgi:hypothetical protein
VLALGLVARVLDALKPAGTSFLSLLAVAALGAVLANLLKGAGCVVLLLLRRWPDAGPCTGKGDRRRRYHTGQ